MKNAFLQGDLAEEAYMKQPPRFVAQGEKGRICRLRKTFYGLKHLRESGKRSLVIQFRGLVCIDISLIILYFLV